MCDIIIFYKYIYIHTCNTLNSYLSPSITEQDATFMQYQKTHKRPNLKIQCELYNKCKSCYKVMYQVHKIDRIHHEQYCTFIIYF